METYKAIQTAGKMWCYTFELRKRRNFFAKLQTKVQKPFGRNKMLRNYLHTNQTNTNKKKACEVEEIEHDSSGKLFAYS